MSILEKKDGFHVGLYLLGDDVKLLWTTIFFPLFFYLLFFFLSLKLGSSCIVAWLLTYLDLSLFSILLLLLLLLLLLVLSLSLPLSLSLSVFAYCLASTTTTNKEAEDNFLAGPSWSCLYPHWGSSWPPCGSVLICGVFTHIF